MTAAPAASVAPVRIRPRSVTLLNAAGTVIARGVIVAADEVPQVVLFHGDAFLLQGDAGAAQLSFRRIHAYRADATFQEAR